jgi:hypothetical protein
MMAGDCMKGYARSMDSDPRSAVKAAGEQFALAGDNIHDAGTAMIIFAKCLQKGSTCC